MHKHTGHRGTCFGSHHVPYEVGGPVEQRMDATDEMHVFGFADPLLDEEDHEARRHEGHGEDDADGHKDVHGGRHPGDEEQKEVVGRDKGGGG